MKIGKGAAKFRAACPNLEHLDMGFTDSRVHSDNSLIEIVEQDFAKLESIAVNLWNISGSSLGDACASLGTNLKHLRIGTSLW